MVSLHESFIWNKRTVRELVTAWEAGEGIVLWRQERLWEADDSNLPS